ncbi:MAG: hypothetical protein JNM18_23435 [Planctomycetaceae bacterium]|nr:hypothetical protein [Planctomycetaceae bacterium]
MKKRLLAVALTAVVMVSTAVQAMAQEMKPVIVASLAGYNELLKDIGFVGKVSEMPDLAQSVEGLVAFVTQFQGLAGLDKSKPIGVAVNTDGTQFQVIGFVPVEDLDKLLAALQGLVGEATDGGDGCKIIRVKGFPLFVKAQDGWAFISYAKDAFASLPKDPTKLLGTLHTEYDLGVRVHMQNIPQAFRDIGLGQLQAGAQQGMKRLPNESDEAFELRKKLTQEQIGGLSDAFKEMDQITLGVAIDSVDRRLFLDVGVTVLPGGKLAKQLAGLENVKSAHTGFLAEADDSVANLHLASVMSEADAKQALSALESVRAQAMTELEKKLGNATEAEKAQVTGWARDVFDVLTDTIKAGSLNGGAALVGEGPITLGAGMIAVGGERIEKAFKEFIALAQTKPGYDKAQVKVKFDADEHAGVRFHTVTIPIPDDEKGQQAKEFLGDEIVLNLGFGKNSIFFAVGEDGVEALSEVIDESAKGVAEAMPFELNVALGPIINLALLSEPDKEELKVMAEALEKGDDYISITTEANGLSQLMRLEVEEGVIRALGLTAKAAASKKRQ